MKSRRILLFLLLLTITALFAACNRSETQEHAYKDYHALIAAEEMDRGWAPEFLPASAANIHLKYNLDDNAILMAFDFAPEDATSLTKACAAVHRVLPPKLTADWWPDDLPTDAAASFHQCLQGNLAVKAGKGYYWAGVSISPDAIEASDLDAHPKKYLDLVGKEVTVTGYVDFSNIQDLREMHYLQNGIGFVRKPGQTADSVFYVYFLPEVDPAPLFDILHELAPTYEETGLRLVATGVLRAYEQRTNFLSKTGYVIEVDDVNDVLIAR